MPPSRLLCLVVVSMLLACTTHSRLPPAEEPQANMSSGHQEAQPPEEEVVASPEQTNEAPEPGGTKRFECPGGEVPDVVDAGCMCSDGRIENPCDYGDYDGKIIADVELEENVCVFQCP